MDHKIQKSTDKKIIVNADSQATASDHLLIANRTIVDQDKVADDIPSEISTDETPAAQVQATPHHNVILPRSAADYHAATKDGMLKPTTAKPHVKQPDTPPEPTSEPAQVDKVTEEAPDTADINNLTPIPKVPESPSADTVKRDQEVENIIESHQYFVPIDAIGRRRSINVSIVLTVVVFLLSIVLIDVMLDSGTILLLQKIPHTHFFSSNNN